MPVISWLENVARMIRCDLLHRDVRFRNFQLSNTMLRLTLCNVCGYCIGKAEVTMQYVISHKRDASEFAISGLGDRLVYANKQAASRMKDMYPSSDGFEIETVESHNARLTAIGHDAVVDHHVH